MLQNVILGLAGSKEKPADPLDFVIHGDIRRTSALGETGEAKSPPTPEQRQQSQEALMDALKSAYPRKD